MAKRLLRPRVLVPVALVMVFLAAGWTVRNQLAADRQGEWVRVTRGDLVTGVDVTGTLASAEAGSFGPPQLNDVWDFKISMMAPEGSEVTAGRPILGFDTSELQRRLEEKSAEAEQARKEIEKRRADLRLRREDEKMNLAEADGRLRKTAMKLEAPADLTGSKERKQVELDYSLSRQETTQIRSRLDDLERAANAEIALLESKQRSAVAIVAETQDGIRHMTILAPRSGTVVYTTSRRGDKKKVGDSCWRMERVIEIPDLNRLVAQGDLDEVDAGKAAVGQRVKFHLDAHPDEEFRGTIRTAAKTVQQQQGTTDPLKVLRVEIALDRSDAATMRPGMRFQGTVELGRVPNAVLLPRSAVFSTLRGPVAYRRGLFKVETVSLRLGRQNAESVEVLSGLRPGDRIMVPTHDGKEQEKS
jgi:HlyD family secretion protein